MQWLNTARPITFFILIIGIEHSNGTTIRGCSPPQQIEPIKEDHFELCQTDKCNGDMFNGQNQLDEEVPFVVCYAGVQKFKKKNCESFDDTCFTYINGSEVIRGCTMEYLVENDLKGNFFFSIPDSKYEICDKPLCNSRDIKPAKCYACESKSGSDSNCVGGTLTEEMTKECPIAIKPSNCFHFIDFNQEITSRGCMTDLSNEVMLGECKKSGKVCKQCQGDLCNSMRKFQKCSTCGTGPAACNSAVCKDYRDRCFTHVNQFNVQRGCLSTANDNNDSPATGIDIGQDCENDDSICKTCSGEDNCNHDQVSDEHCIVCDSNESIDCILNPKVEAMRSKCPLAMKTLGCFIALRDKLRVVRGCMSSLGTDERKACNEENETCKSCSGDSCNQQMHFFTCHSCNSTNDPKCLAKPNNSESISCLNSKKCYTEIRDGAVRRGCVGDENIPAIEKCSAPICRSCDDKMDCNNEPVHVEKCVKCDSKNEDEEWCNSDSIATGFQSEECNLEAVQQGCFHHINDNGLIMKRGCVNKLANDSDFVNDCKSNSDKCKICHGENCNVKSTFPKCLHCNYLEQTQCAIQPLNNNVISRICASYMDQCFTYIENKNISRGCVSDFEPEQLKKCLDAKEMCAICDPASEANCNKHTFELERCIECDSDIHGEECRNNTKDFEGRICNGFKESQPKGCFLSIVGEHYKRGCISKLSQNEAKNCLSQSNICKTSFGSNSNSKVSFLECYTCNSRDNPECSRNSMNNTRTELCKSLHATCSTGIDDHGVTHRRCTRENDGKHFTDHAVCVTSKCNGEIYPSNRLQCYQCNGDDKCNLMPASAEAPDSNPVPTSNLDSNLNGQLTKSLEKLPCNVLSKYDQCYTYIDKDGQNVNRGCLTDYYDSRLLCDMNDKLCIKCNESGCNNQPKLRKPSLKCIHCTDEFKCAYGQDKTTSKVCEKHVLFNVKESCYARSLSNGTIFDRGCTVDLMEKQPIFLCTAENNCSMCDTPDCNAQNIIQRKCQKCSSLIDGDCIYGNGGPNRTVLCDGEPYPHSKSGCYTYVNDHHVERGCVKDLKEKYDECMRETESCVICDTDNCNIDDHSVGHRMTSTVLLNVFAIFILFSFI